METARLKMTDLSLTLSCGVSEPEDSQPVQWSGPPEHRRHSYSLVQLSFRLCLSQAFLVSCHSSCRFYFFEGRLLSFHPLWVSTDEWNIILACQVNWRPLNTWFFCLLPLSQRHSFNEEADLLTLLQEGPFSTSMGSPWKPLFFLSIIGGLSGKNF